MIDSLVHEDDCDLSHGNELTELASISGFSDVLELCYFCEKPTRFWHAPSNEPVCFPCADERGDDAMPTLFQDIHPCYLPKIKMNLRQAQLRAFDEELELLEVDLMGNRAKRDDLNEIRQQRLQIQNLMESEGLIVVRRVKLASRRKATIVRKKGVSASRKDEAGKSATVVRIKRKKPRVAINIPEETETR